MIPVLLVAAAAAADSKNDDDDGRRRDAARAAADLLAVGCCRDRAPADPVAPSSSNNTTGIIAVQYTGGLMLVCCYVVPSSYAILRAPLVRMHSLPEDSMQCMSCIQSKTAPPSRASLRDLQVRWISSRSTIDTTMRSSTPESWRYVFLENISG